jgi:hypothetical protein
LAQLATAYASARLSLALRSDRRLPVRPVSAWRRGRHRHGCGLR